MCWTAVIAYVVLAWYQYKWAKTDEEKQSQSLPIKKTYKHEKVIIVIIVCCKKC